MAKDHRVNARRTVALLLSLNNVLRERVIDHRITVYIARQINWAKIKWSTPKIIGGELKICLLKSIEKAAEGIGRTKRIMPAQYCRRAKTKVNFSSSKKIFFGLVSVKIIRIRLYRKKDN